MKTLTSTAVALILLVIALHASADQIINENLIVQGKACTGIDCINDQVFGEETVRLRENNTRMTFIDVTAEAGAESWRMVANESANEGSNHFQFQVKPDLTATDTGTAIVYLGVPADDSIALGNGSEIISGAVTVGQAGLERRIRHVASMLANTTDLATIGNLDSYFDAFNADLDVVDAKLDELEEWIVLEENRTAVTPFRTGGGSTSPFALLVLLACIMAFRYLWKGAGENAG